MKVVVDSCVFETLDKFYDISRRIHPTLDLSTCIAKINRLETALKRFAVYAEYLHKTPYRKDWQQAGYYEFVVERFHFAYRVYVLPDGEKVLRYHDVVYDLLNYNEEDTL